MFLYSQLKPLIGHKNLTETYNIYVHFRLGRLWATYAVAWPVTGLHFALLTV